MSDYGIVVIDMQVSHAYYSERFNREMSVVAERQMKILENDIPRVFLEYDMADFTGTRSDLFNCGMDSVIIEKTGCDGFAGSQGRPQELEYQLKNVFGVNKLVVFGFHSDACVYLTIESGLKRGFEIHTSQDLSYPLTRKPEEFLLGLRKKHDKLTVHQSVDELLGAIA